MSSQLTLVLGAVPWEIKPVAAAMMSGRIGMLRRFPYRVGRIGSQQVVTANTGVGKTNGKELSPKDEVEQEQTERTEANGGLIKIKIKIKI